MTINKRIIKDLEHSLRRFLPKELKTYLLMKYEREPFPYEYSEQDLYTNIEKDIYAFDAGELDITNKSLSKRWEEEYQYLQELYIDKCYELHKIEDYVQELELLITEHGLKSSKMNTELIDF
jgi:hypothetical protein